MDIAESIEEFAARMFGMHRREIIDVTKHADGLVVTTHDGQRTLLAADGTTQPWTGELPVPAAEPVAEAEPAAAAKADRGR